MSTWCCSWTSLTWKQAAQWQVLTPPPPPAGAPLVWVRKAAPRLVLCRQKDQDECQGSEDGGLRHHKGPTPVGSVPVARGADCGFLDPAGGRGYFLKGDGVLLNLALIQAAMAHAVGRGFTPVQTPFFMRQDAMAACAQLDDFDEQLYKVSGEPCPNARATFVLADAARSCTHAATIRCQSFWLAGSRLGGADVCSLPPQAHQQMAGRRQTCARAGALVHAP